ncbi:hypothetical protein AHMF7605_22405 [Adhaeribacter arboris]|uniref:Uncharacterized protein n=1 Tax=Adhaeribacter arboris TaxID=2072846 RepID=A0A2T2YKL2_9BACT|nr:hypothetical protein [Adhaeribacter arboris]PSR56053.1 hypothetical protein AHMF7605_22405 [Adhaeribacter arboris]
MENKDKEIALLQSQAREKAVKEGNNPDILFAIKPDVVFNAQALLEVVAYDEPYLMVQALDSFIFEFLQVLSDASSDNSLHSDVYHHIWRIKRLRDAILHGLPDGIPLGDGDHKDSQFTM